MKADANKLVLEAYSPGVFKKTMNMAGLEYGQGLSIQNIFHQQMDKLIKEVLRKVLEREPTIEDAKDCAIIVAQGIDDQFDFAYKGVKLGSINWFFNFGGIEGNTFNATFTPC